MMVDTGKPRLLLGVDGGGSSTVTWLAEQTSDGVTEIRGKGTAGPSNCRSVGFETAFNNVAESIDRALLDAGHSKSSVDSACLALAGADRSSERTQFQAWAERSQIANTITITNDALPIIYSAFEDGVGIGLIAGTGSIAIARTQDNRVYRSGGWGGLLGDEGSGYWIAIAGLRAACRCEDGRGPETSLHPRFLNHFNCKSLQDAIPNLYAPSTDRAQIASLAVHVFQAVQDGDSMAQQLLQNAAEELAELVLSLADRMATTNASIRLAVGGSVLLKQPDFTNDLIDVIQQKRGLQVIVKRVADIGNGTINLAKQAVMS